MTRNSVGAWVAVALVIGVAAGTASAKGSASGLKGTAVGTITNEKGKPVEGAEVTIESEGSKPVTAKSNAKGEYVMPGVPVGDVKVRIRARGYFAYEDTAVVAGKGNTTIPAVLRLGVLFAGVVQDERGKSIAGVEVTAIRKLQPDELPDFDAEEPAPRTTDADGRFTVEDLPPAKRYTLEFRSVRHVLGRIEDLPGKGGAPKDGLSVTLKDASWVTGVVVDAAGKPVAGARVHGGDDKLVVPPKSAYDIEQEKKSGRDGTLTRIFNSILGVHAVRTDAQGKFTFGGIEGDAITLVIDADGFFLSNVPVAELKAGEEKSGVQAALEPTTAALEGWLLDAAGKPVQLGRVSLATADGDRAAEGRADEVGHFLFPRVRAKAPVKLVASGYRVVEAVLEGVALGQKALRVKMAASPRVKVKVVDSAGALIKDVFVRIESAAGEESGRSSSGSWEKQDEGGFELDVPVGDVTIHFAGKGTEWKTSSSISTKGGKVYPLPDLVLPAKGS